MSWQGKSHYDCCFDIPCSVSVSCQWRPGAEDTHDDVIKWKHFPRNWPFVRGIHRSPVNSPRKGLWRGALMFSLICVWINDWVNNREAGDLRRHLDHYGVSVMWGRVFGTQWHKEKIPYIVMTSWLDTSALLALWMGNPPLTVTVTRALMVYSMSPKIFRTRNPVTDDLRRRVIHMTSMWSVAKCLI